MPLMEKSEPPAPVILPLLTKLRLCGMEVSIERFMDLVSMASPLYSIVFSFDFRNNRNVSALASAVKKVLTSYYGCQGLDHSHKPNRLTCKGLEIYSPVIKAESHSTSASHPTSNLKLQFNGLDDTPVEEICLLFPLSHVHEFNVVQLDLPRREWY